MSSKCCHTGPPSSEPSLPTIVNLWTKRQVCIASLCPLHHAHAMGVMWEMFGILKTVQFLTDSLVNASSNPPLHLVCLHAWTVRVVCVSEILQTSFVMAFYHHGNSYCGFIVSFQAASQRQTVSWLWWPPASTTSVSTVWCPTAHCTGSTLRNQLLLIRYLIYVT